jgi:hypothetical protein
MPLSGAPWGGGRVKGPWEAKGPQPGRKGLSGVDSQGKKGPPRMTDGPQADVRRADERETSVAADADLLERVLAWLEEEDVAFEPVDPHASNAFELQLTMATDVGPVHATLVRPLGRPVLGLVLMVELAPEHRTALAALPPYERARFQQRVRRRALAGGIVAFTLHGDADGVRGWELEARLYDDGLTQDAFHLRLRALVLKHLELVEAVQESLGFGPRFFEGPVPGAGL